VESREEAVDGSELTPFHEEVHEEEGMFDGNFVVLVKAAVAHVRGVHAAREERDKFANAHEGNADSMEEAEMSGPHDAHMDEFPPVDTCQRYENNADKVGDNVQPDVHSLSQAPGSVEVSIRAVLTESVQGFSFVEASNEIVVLSVVLLREVERAHNCGAEPADHGAGLFVGDSLDKWDLIHGVREFSGQLPMLLQVKHKHP